MASPASTEANEVRRRGRRRLIGAIAIVILLVVFVPMILDSQPGTARNEPVLAIPPKDTAAPLPAPSAPSEPPASAGVTPPAAPAKVTAAPAAAPPQRAAAAPRLEGFAVQVGAFRDEATLEQARAKLAGAGIPHYIERIDAAAGAPGLTRLRAGPFATRAAAEAALPRLRKASLDGQVVALP